MSNSMERLEKTDEQLDGATRRRRLSLGFSFLKQCFTLDNTSVVKGEDV